MGSAFVVFAFLGIVLMVIFGIGFLALILVSRGRDIRTPQSPVERQIIDQVENIVPFARFQADLENVFSLGKAQPIRDGRAMEFRATIGWRVGYIVCVACLAYFCRDLESDPGQAGQTPAFVYMGLAVVLVWCGIYLWQFRLRIDGNELACTTGRLETRRFDLALLDAVRETKGGLSLNFSDGDRINVPQFLDGQDVLRQTLIATLVRNGR